MEASTLHSQPQKTFNINGGTTDRTADLFTIDADVNSASVDGLFLDLDVGTALSAAEIANGINVDVAGLGGDDSGSFINAISLTGDTTSAGTVTGIELEGSFDADIDFQNDTTLTNTSTNDLDFTDNSVTLNLDFAETTASTITLSTASDLTLDSSAASVNITAAEDAADSIVLSSTAGGIDITTASTEDLDIDAAGGLNLTSSEVAADALALTVDGGTSATLSLNSDGTGASAIDLNATGTGGGEVAVNTSDGAIALTAAGSTNGDITATAGDDFLIDAVGVLELNSSAGR